MNNTLDVPVQIDDPINAAILRVSEDTLQGFQTDPFAVIADRAGFPVDQVIGRIRAMVEAGKKAGAPITYVEVPGGSHVSVAQPAFAPMMEFFSKVVKGKAVASE